MTNAKLVCKFRGDRFRDGWDPLTRDKVLSTEQKHKPLPSGRLKTLQKNEYTKWYHKQCCSRIFVSHKNRQYYWVLFISVHTFVTSRVWKLSLWQSLFTTNGSKQQKMYKYTIKTENNLRKINYSLYLYFYVTLQRICMLNFNNGIAYITFIMAIDT